MLSPLTSTQSETESENGQPFFRPTIYVNVPSIGHFHHFHFLKTICNHNLEQEQVKPCPEKSQGHPYQSVADFPAVFFHISHWYLLWY